MIHTMKDTTTSEVSRVLIELREDTGLVTLGRIATLVVISPEDHLDDSIDVAVHASHEHPARIIVIVPQGDTDRNALDAEVRVGADAGAGELIVLRPSGLVVNGMDTLITPLLLPDAPIVTWWSAAPPVCPSQDVVGALSTRRITDALAADDPNAVIRRLSHNYHPGDTDLCWSRLTNWRGLLAAAYEQPPISAPTAVTIEGKLNKPTVTLMRQWLADFLSVPVTVKDTDGDFGLISITLHREDGDITLRRVSPHTVIVSTPGETDDQSVTMPVRTMHDLLSEELRRLDADDIYGTVLTAAFPHHVDVKDFATGKPAPSDIRVKDKDDLIEHAAQFSVEMIDEAVRERGIAHIAMTGGRTGTQVARRIGELLHSTDVAASKVHVWWGDERFVETKSDDRNDRPALSALTLTAGIPVYNVHSMPASDMGMELDDAAAWYGQQLSLLGADSAHTEETDEERAFFDVVLLGMGEDGHIASLFPDHEDAGDATRSAVSVRNSPKPPSERISLTWPMLNAARHVVFLVAGEEKAELAARAHGDIDPVNLPASAVRGTVSTTWFLDPEAASAIEH